MAKFSRLGPIWRKPRPKPWKQLKNCARWSNERFEQQLWFEENLSVTESISRHLQRTINDSVTITDVYIGKPIINLTETVSASDNVVSEANYSRAVSDSVLPSDGTTISKLYEGGVFNEALLGGFRFNAVAFPSEYFEDTVSVSDSVVKSAEDAATDSVGILDLAQFTFIYNGPFNNSVMNLSTLN